MVAIVFTRRALSGPERSFDLRLFMNHRLHTWAAGIAAAAALASLASLASLAAPAAPARAGWTLASADKSVTVVRGATVTEAAAGDVLSDGDLLKTGESAVYLQDGHGSLVALGPQTRAMLTADAHVALLRGWLKIAAASCAAAPCPRTRVDTERGPFDIGPGAAAIIAALEETDTIDLFSETGAQIFATKPPATIPNGHFATIDSHGHLQLSARPSDTFVEEMPVAFRDALQPLNAAKPSHPAPPSRAVTYDDIAPWLSSKLPERRTFPARFRPRLADTAFRHDIETHLKELPDWHVLIYPPVRSTVRVMRYPSP